MDKVILHSDLNNFYASVECALNPDLSGKPIAVCGDKELRHGIVLAKNQLAKNYGVKTGEVIWQAKQKCGDLVILSANFPLYLKYSRLVRGIYERFTDKVESFGIDECWLDTTESTLLFGSGEEIADKIRQAVKSELNLTVSVGVSWNKVFAKLASDMKKPDATTVISRDNYKSTVFKLPAESLLFVGKATKEKLYRCGLRTVGDIANADIQFLKEILGKWGEYLSDFANGNDMSPVMKNDQRSIVKSVGNSTTPARDLKNLADIKMIVTVLSESVSARLREQGLKGQVVSVSVTDNNFCDWGKQIKISEPTFNSKDILAEAMALIKNHYQILRPVRRVGVAVSDLTPASESYQTNIFLSGETRQKAENLEHAIDNLKHKYGNKTLNRATVMVDPVLTDLNPKDENTIHPNPFLK